MPPFQILIRWLNLILVITTFFSYLSPYVNPGTFWFISFLGIAYPWFLLFNILFVVYWLARKLRFFWYSLGCILLGWTHLIGFVGFHVFSGDPDEHSIRVLTYNMRILSTGSKDLDQNVYDNTRDFFKKTGADVLCIQEFKMLNKVAFEMLKKYRIGDVYPYLYKEDKIAVMILSRYPIVGKGNLKLQEWGNGCLFADIRKNGKTVRVYCMHLHSNRVTETANQVMSEGDFKEEHTWFQVRHILAKVKNGAAIRALQAEKVAAHIAASPYPVIVCGDMNETPQSYVYHLISHNLNDAFKEKAFGLGSTFAGSIPALRIDYILTDPRLQIRNHRILKSVKFSDHYPVVSDIGM